MAKPNPIPARFRIPVIDGKTPSVSLGDAEGMNAFLVPMGSPEMAARIGAERERAYQMAVDVRLDPGRFFVQETLGERFAASGGHWRQGGRLIVHDHAAKAEGSSDLASSRICAALNFTRSEASEGRRLTVLSNLVVKDSHRGLGLASFLVEGFLLQNPRAVLDASMTEFGARFFGFDPEDPQVRRSPRPGRIFGRKDTP